jgi:predicted tellurium resistance membrane protein TerC
MRLLVLQMLPHFVKRKGFFRLFGLIERHPTIAISLGVFILGVGLGFYAYGVYQQKLEVLVPVAILLAILTWFGVRLIYWVYCVNGTKIEKNKKEENKNN